MYQPIETIEKDNATIKIYQDADFADDPREYDNLGTMICFHGRYNLGDKHDFYNADHFMEWLEENEKDLIILPLYLFDHSGITMSTSSQMFSQVDSMGWDWGMVGYIYVTKEKIRQEYGWKYVTSKRASTIRELLKNEVEIYDQYLTGDVYGFKVICNRCGEEIDSCWGFYGHNWEDNGLLDTAFTQCDCEEDIQMEIHELLTEYAI
jgi:hypothetical protein